MWDEMEDGLMNSIVTPAETFFFALFVLGVLTLAATTLVGTCGNVDDFEKEVTQRSLDIAPGTMAVLRVSETLGDTTVGAGTCVIVERVNEGKDDEEEGLGEEVEEETEEGVGEEDEERVDEEATAYVHVLAKHQHYQIFEDVAEREDETTEQEQADEEGEEEVSVEAESGETEIDESGRLNFNLPEPRTRTSSFASYEDEYRPLSPFRDFFKAPFSTLLFLHEGTPKGDVPLRSLFPVETQTYTSWFRNFYLNGIYVVMALLSVLLAFLVYIGARFEKKRKQWYKWHTLRATYISRLMQDKEKTRQLQENWARVSAIMEEDKSSEWDEALMLLQETLDGVLALLRFEGKDLTEKLQNMTEDDLWNIEKLWEANSTILRAKKQVEEEDEDTLPVITEKIMEKIAEIYMTSFIWLGLLPHHFAAKDDE